MEHKYKGIKKLKKIEDENQECYKCGIKGVPLYEDENIEGLYFCEECWSERFKTEEIENWGFEEEIPYE